MSCTPPANLQKKSTAHH